MATVGDLDLRDEYAFLPQSAVLSDVSKALIPVKNSAVLLRKKKNGPVLGIVKVNHLLRALKSGKDPSKVLATSIMDENLLRIKSTTPLEKSQSIVLERQPAGIIVLDENNLFLGYLSPNDYRSYAQEELDDNSKLGDTIGSAVNLRDEYAILPLNSSLEEVSLKLRIPHVQFVLLKHKKEGIQGVITPCLLLNVIASGSFSSRTQAKKHMKPNVIRLRNDTPVDLAIKTIQEKRPDAVLVLDKDGTFVGVLSPRDYHSLLHPLTEIASEVVAPPRPPVLERAPPPMPPMPTSDDVNLSLDDLSAYLEKELFPGKTPAVVWEYEGSNLVLYKENTSIHVSGKNLKVGLNLYSDQTGHTLVNLEYELPFEPEIDYMATEGKSHMPDLMEKVWREVLFENIWLVIMNWMRDNLPRRRKQIRFGLNLDGSMTVLGTQQGSIEADLSNEG